MWCFLALVVAEKGTSRTWSTIKIRTCERNTSFYEHLWTSDSGCLYLQMFISRMFGSQGTAVLVFVFVLFFLLRQKLKLHPLHNPPPLLSSLSPPPFSPFLAASCSRPSELSVLAQSCIQTAHTWRVYLLHLSWFWVPLLAVCCVDGG